MSKLERIFDYLNKNKDKEKTALIKDIKEKFNVSDISAPMYFSQWKTYRKKMD